MTGYEKLTSVTRHHHVDSRVSRLREQCQFGNFQNIFLANFRMAAVGHMEHIVKTTENGIERLQRTMLEYTEHLCVQRVFGYSVMMVKSGLRRPTDIKGGRDMRTRPIENLGNLVPIGHFLKIHLFHRSAGDNHAVILLVTHLLKIRVESFHMFYRSIL